MYKYQIFLMKNPWRGHTITINPHYPEIHKEKKDLNNEFWNKGRTGSAISILYYPVTYGPMSHGEN